MIGRGVMKPGSTFWRHLQRVQRDFVSDRRGIAAIEFAFILPLMLVVFFGVVEFSAGLASARKVTLTASSLADLTSEMQASGNVAPIADSDFQNMFNSGVSIMNPYLQGGATSVTAEIDELYVDTSFNVTYSWSKMASAGPTSSTATFVASPHSPGDPFTGLPSALKVAKTYVIYARVSYTYQPTFDYGGLMSMAGVNLSDVAYSRPRQATCIVYNNTQPQPDATGKCPTP
jgi:Flp pilus assembly protein TadG